MRLDLLDKFSGLLSPNEKIQFRRLVLLMLLAALLEAGGVALIYPFVMVVNQPTTAPNSPLLLALMQGLSLADSKQLAWVLGGFVLLFFLAKNLFLAFLYQFKYRLLFNSQVTLSSTLLQQYLAQPYPFHLNHNSSQLTVNLRDNALWIFSHLLDPLLVMLTEIMVLGLIILTLLMIKPWVSIWVLLGSGLLGFVFVLALKQSASRHGIEQQQHLQQMNLWLQQSLGSIKTTKLHHTESYFIQQYTHSAQHYATANAYHKTINRLPKPFFETIVMSFMALGVMVALAYNQDLNHYLPLVAVFGLAALRMIPSINAIIGSLHHVQFYYPALEAICRDYHPIPRHPLASPHAAHPPLAFTDCITLNHIEYTYPNAPQAVLQGISLTIKKGQTIGLVGSSGAGKSTLIDIVLGLLPPTQGSLWVDKTPLTAEHLPAWQQKIGYIPQTIDFLDDSIKNNIAFAIPTAQIDNQRILQVLATVQLTDFIRNLPQGIETPIGERGVKLSGGQRQRLGIARALYRNPEILVLDEATSALDSLTEQAISHAISQLHGAKTILIIAHRLTTLQHADVIFYLAHGKIAQAGTYSELYVREPQFRKMVDQLDGK